jgi:hypothetical protein
MRRINIATKDPIDSLPKRIAKPDEVVVVLSKDRKLLAHPSLSMR